MRKFKSAGILVCAVILLFGVVQAAPAAGLWNVGHRAEAGGETGPCPLTSLGLSDQQLTQIREMRQSTYNQTRNLRSQIMDTKFALSQLKLQNKVDQAAVNAKVKELQDLHSQMKNNRLQARQKLQTILTPDQWNKLEATCKDRHPERNAGAGGR